MGFAYTLGGPKTSWYNQRGQGQYGSAYAGLGTTPAPGTPATAATTTPITGTGAPTSGPRGINVGDARNGSTAGATGNTQGLPAWLTSYFNGLNGAMPDANKLSQLQAANGGGTWAGAMTADQEKDFWAHRTPQDGGTLGTNRTPSSTATGNYGNSPDAPSAGQAASGSAGTNGPPSTFSGTWSDGLRYKSGKLYPFDNYGNPIAGLDSSYFADYKNVDTMVGMYGDPNSNVRFW